MKKLIYIGLLCLTYLTTFAQEAEQIDLGPYGNIRTNKKPIEYFESQIKLWEKKVKQNNKDANAWLNYFAATKCARQMEFTKSLDEIRLKPGSKMGMVFDMPKSEFEYKKIAQEAYKHLPNSFEANYMMHFADNSDIKRDYKYLVNANKIRPFDLKLLLALIQYYDLINDKENVRIVANEIAKTSIITSYEFNLAYNILTEIEDNSMLITTTSNYYACLTLQKVKNLKSNVVITSNSSIFPLNYFEYVYMDTLFSRIGLKEKSKKLDTIGRTLESLNENFKQTKLKHIKTILNAKIPIFITNTAISTFNDFSDKLYIHGLTYRYSKQPANYIYNIKDNYEKNYSLDYIKHDISPNPTDNYEQSLYSMYYPSALKMYEYYKEKGQFPQQQDMKKFIQVLAEKSGKDFIKNSYIFNENEIVTYSRAEIDFKKLQASFVALNAVEHIGKFEVTNGEYNLFLKNLKQTKNYELYYKCYPDTTLWNKNFAMAFHDPLTNMYNCHPAYSNYPIVNITHEGAVAYCKWLTVQYNQQHPEGKYVSFRLPSEQEWRYAAGSKNEKSISPFPNDNILSCDPAITGKKKSKNEIDTTEHCLYLGNIKTDKGYQADGGFHTISVTSYRPNAFGIYNTFGNVAEMTSTKGVIKGGSWADLFSECTFDKNANYSDLDPRVGFRIMMEVIPDIKHNSVVKIDKNVYCRKYEDRILDYERYLKNIIQLYGINSMEYKNAFPDSILWKNENIQALNNVLNVAQLKDSLKIIRAFEKSFALLDTLTKTQLDNYLKYKSDEEFKAYLIENEYIKNLYMHNNPPIFTKEAYYTGKLDSICLKEKFMYYPVVSVPTEHQKQVANSYTNKQLEKGEYAPTNPNSIYSSYVNKTYYDLIQHKSKSFPGYYRIYELKKGVKTSDIKPFDLWENYRFVLTWQPWNPTKTN